MRSRIRVTSGREMTKHTLFTNMIVLHEGRINAYTLQCYTIKNVRSHLERMNYDIVTTNLIIGYRVVKNFYFSTPRSVYPP